MNLKRQEKGPNRKEDFSKLDEFDLGVIRRILHGCYSRNETFFSKKLQKQLKEEIAFPYSTFTLGFVLKKLGFRFKRPQQESIIHERSDLIAWRESFLGRIKEIREKEPERQIVYTDETWLNSEHRVKKKMDRFEGFRRSTPLNPRLRNHWVYKRSSWQRKATYNCGLYYRR